VTAGQGGESEESAGRGTLKGMERDWSKDYLPVKRKCINHGNSDKKKKKKPFGNEKGGNSSLKKVYRAIAWERGYLGLHTPRG